MTDVSVYVSGGAGVVAAELSGEITSTTATGLYEQLEPLVAAQGRLRLDLSKVTYISSAGLRVLVLLHRRAQQAQAAVELTGLTEELRFVMSATGFLDLFDVAPGAAEAPAAKLHREAA
jgi:anti-sigma B factor antagonist